MRLLLTGPVTSPTDIPTSQPSALGTSSADLAGRAIGQGANWGSQLLQMVGALAIIAAVLGLVWWLMRRYTKRGAGSRSIEIIERCMLTRDASLVVARVGARDLLLGVTKERITLLENLGDEEEHGGINTKSGRQADVSPQADVPNGFMGRFTHNLLVNTGIKKGPAVSPQGWRTAEDDRTGKEAPNFGDLLSKAQSSNNETTNDNPIAEDRTPAESGRLYIEGLAEASAESAGGNSEATHLHGDDNELILPPEVRQEDINAVPSPGIVPRTENMRSVLARYNETAASTGSGNAKSAGGVEYLPSTARKSSNNDEKDSGDGDDKDGKSDKVDELLEKIAKRSDRYKNKR